jgi:hypothetical protein
MRKSRIAGGIVQPDRGDEQSEQQRHDALQRIGERDEHGAEQAERDEPEVFEGRELEGDLGEGGRGHDQHRSSK